MIFCFSEKRIWIKKTAGESSTFTITTVTLDMLEIMTSCKDHPVQLEQPCSMCHIGLNKMFKKNLDGRWRTP